MSSRNQIDWSKISKILVHKPDHIGDLLCTAPALALVKKASPAATITAGAMPEPARFWKLLNLIDEVQPLPGPSWYAKADVLSYIRWARQQSFDLILNFRYDFRDITAIQACGAGLSCTYDHRGLAKFAPYKVSVNVDLCETDNHLKLVSTMGLKSSAVYRAKLKAPDAEFARKHLSGLKKTVAFHPFAGSSAKRWPIKYVIETVRALHENNFVVALMGSEENRMDAQLIGEACPGIVNLVSQTTPGQLFAVVDSADVLIATDSGPGHIGPLVNTPVVSLMSGTNEAKRWAPKGARIIYEGAPCAPCAKRHCDVEGHPCMTGISPCRVIDTVIEVLKP